MIYQDPYSSLNPRHTVGAPFRLQRVKTEHGIKGSVQDLLELLNPEHYNRYPHEFSGGQRQRIYRGCRPGNRHRLTLSSAWRPPAARQTAHFTPATAAVTHRDSMVYANRLWAGWRWVKSSCRLDPMDRYGATARS